jgi:hypothetical protein
MISHPSPKTFRRGYKRTCYAARRHTTRECWASRGCSLPQDGTRIRRSQRLANRVRVLQV